MSDYSRFPRIPIETLPTSGAPVTRLGVEGLLGRGPSPGEIFGAVARGVVGAFDAGVRDYGQSGGRDTTREEEIRRAQEFVASFRPDEAFLNNFQTLSNLGTDVALLGFSDLGSSTGSQGRFSVGLRDIPGSFASQMRESGVYRGAIPESELPQWERFLVEALNPLDPTGFLPDVATGLALVRGGQKLTYALEDAPGRLRDLARSARALNDAYGLGPVLDERDLRRLRRHFSVPGTETLDRADFEAATEMLNAMKALPEAYSDADVRRLLNTLEPRLGSEGVEELYRRWQDWEPIKPRERQLRGQEAMEDILSAPSSEDLGLVALPPGVDRYLRETTRAVDESGNPLRLIHGTGWVYDQPSLGSDSGDNLYGPGYYMTTGTRNAEGIEPVTAGYASKGVGVTPVEPGPNFAQEMRGMVGLEIPESRSMLGFESRVGVDADIRAWFKNATLDSNLLLEEVLGDVRPSADGMFEVLPVRVGFRGEGGRWVTRDVDIRADTTFYVPIPPPQNTRLQYLDVRNPADMRRLWSEVPDDDPLKVSMVEHLYGGNTREVQEEVAWLAAREGRDPTLDDLVSNSWPYASSGDRERFLDDIRQMGYDSLVHPGETITGSPPHDVWISFDPENQVINATSPAFQRVSQEAARGGYLNPEQGQFLRDIGGLGTQPSIEEWQSTFADALNSYKEGQYESAIETLRSMLGSEYDDAARQAIDIIRVKLLEFQPVPPSVDLRIDMDKFR